jgi:hypothetical protein
VTVLRTAQALGTGLAILSLAASVRAEVSLQTTVSAERVELQQPFMVRLTVLSSDNEAPQNPVLVAPRGAEVRGPSLSSQNSISINNGHYSRQQGITATWQVTVSTLGRVRIGPASVQVGGQKYIDRPIELEVVPAGQAPGRRGRSRGRVPFDPFDPFGDADELSSPMLPSLGGLGGLLGIPEPDADELPAWPREFNLDAPKDPTAFLDARATPMRVVVGEQVTLSLYAYGKPAPFDQSGGTEPTRNDFMSYVLDDGVQPRLVRMRIGSDIWFATRLGRYALFPLHAGTLTIGSMQTTFVGQGRMARRAYANITRQTQPLSIIVTEPPLATRPSGYRLGDVGHFELTATVEPRQVTAGEAVSVTIELKGTGHLPQRLDPPEQTGIDWLEPTVSGKFGQQQGGAMGGERTFVYVARVKNPGTIDLGKFRLPFWDPNRSAYDIATAKLGSILVRPSATATTATPSASALPERDPLLEAFTPRLTHGATPEPRRRLSDQRWWFPSLAMGPLLVLGLAAMRLGFSRVKQWWAKRRVAPTTLVAEEFARAEQAERANERAATATAIERALHRALEHGVGIPARGLVHDALREQLKAHGIKDETTNEVMSLLEDCDTLRFAMGNTEAPKVVVSSARSTVERLLSEARSTTKRRAKS